MGKSVMITYLLERILYTPLLFRAVSINRFIPFFAVRNGSVIGLAAYRYKGKQLKLKI